MKNIQVIDGAANTAYPIYPITDDGFRDLFPGENQDVEFIDDAIARLGEERVGEILGPAWKQELNKPDVNGIHGTLFYELEHKKRYYPNKRGTDVYHPLTWTE